MANFNFNKVILGGRLTADPELRKTPQDVSVTTFSIAVNRAYGRSNDGQPTADFINVVAWRQTAEFITRYFHKGSSICVTGSLQTRTWTDNNNQKRYATEVIVDEAHFVDSKNENVRSGQYGSADSYGAPAFSVPVENEVSKFEELSSDDDLPF